jgi:hypothetical protein
VRAIAAAALLLLTSCSERKAPAPVATASVSPAPAAPSARRPTRRYYLSRTSSRCEIYRVDEGGFSPPEATPCPLDLHIGESIRIVGKTCQRESQDLTRVEPVVCPDPLTNKEKRDLGLVK